MHVRLQQAAEGALPLLGTRSVIRPAAMTRRSDNLVSKSKYKRLSKPRRRTSICASVAWRPATARGIPRTRRTVPRCVFWLVFACSPLVDTYFPASALPPPPPTPYHAAVAAASDGCCLHLHQQVSGNPCPPSAGVGPVGGAEVVITARHQQPQRSASRPFSSAAAEGARP